MPPLHPTVALVGNPNTGKTTLFNALSGLNQRVGNYPGVTVETKKGRFSWKGQSFEVIDLPGTYSLAARSPDEMVAVDVILGREKGEMKPDLVVTIVDASNLERNLYLTTQVLEIGVPVIVALNMVDMANNQGMTIDAAKLARNLGVPVVPLQANKGKGVEQLKTTIADSMRQPVPSHGPAFPEVFEAEVSWLGQRLGNGFAPFLLRRLLIDVGGYTERLIIEQQQDHLAEYLEAARARLASAGHPVPAVEARTRYGWIRQATAGCLQRPEQRRTSWTDRLDAVLTHRVLGLLVFLALMFLVFQSIFIWADYLMQPIRLGQKALGGWVSSLMDPGPLRSLLADGIVNGVGSVLVFLPQILILFAFIAVLEDCGYMARAAYLMDRLMARAGLSGKSFIPLLSSVACAVPGIMAARVIENRRDRFATILVAPLMSCSARLPVYALLIGAFLSPPDEATIGDLVWWIPGLTLFGMYCIGLVVAPLVAFLLKRTLLRGETPVFVMEMPLYKMPSLWTVFGRMKDSGWAFLRRAGTLILAAMIVVWALLYFPRSLPSPETIGEEEVTTFDGKVAALDEQIKARKEQGEDADELEQQRREVAGEWKRQSILGRFGQSIDPAVRPLGWDWKIGTAALASFPAREVVVATLGILYNEGEEAAEEV